MPRHQGVWREQWATCDRCGFVHPLSMLFMQQGLRLCKDHGCYDDLSNYYRARIIAEVLRDTSEGKSDIPELLRDPQELRF